MKKRTFDEMVSYFNRKVADMEIDRKYKMELLGMITAILQEHDSTIKPEQQWIPCSEGLPKNRDMVLVTVKETLHGDAGCHVEEAYYCEEIWLDVNAIDIEGTSNDVDTFEIIAWMPLPEPYKEGNT